MLFFIATTDSILGFLLTLFESLKVQIGPAVTEQIVQQLLHSFTRQQLAETLLHEGTAGSRVINKFLKILQLLVQEPASSFKTFLPNIIGLCMDQLYPIIIEVRNDGRWSSTAFLKCHNILLSASCKSFMRWKRISMSFFLVTNCWSRSLTS